MSCMFVQQSDAAGLTLESGFNVVLSMPTGSGKTWRAAQAIRRCVAAGRKSIYVSPTRALANELHARWTKDWPEVVCGIFTGDYKQDEQSSLYGASDVLVMTPEKLDLVTRQWRHHWHWLPKLDLVVFDEIHLLADRSRGGRLEGVIVRLRSLNPFARLICLSATLGNPGELATWLGGVAFQTGERAIPLKWSTRTFNKAEEKPRLLLEILQPVVVGGSKSIVFVQSKRRAEHLAALLAEAGIRADYHHAGLHFDRRARVEADFRARAFDVLVATATLEVGLNLPARQVVLYDLQQFQDGEFRPLTVISAWQRAGRAGRPGMDTQGEVVVLRARWEADQRYENGRFEPLTSVLARPEQLAEQVVINVATGFARTRTELASLMSRSLSAQQARLPELMPFVDQMRDAGFLEEVVGDTGSRLRATALGRICSRLMVSPESLLRVRRLLQRAIPWTYFDLLLLACVASDADSTLSVDYEELDELASSLGQQRSAWLCASTSVELDALCNGVVTPKRFLSCLKAASALSHWTTSGSLDLVAATHHTYPGELRRVIDSSVRMLTAMGAVIDLPAADDESVAPSMRSPLDAASKAQLAAKVRRLLTMVDAGLDQDAVSLTLVPGVGKTWALRLVDAGIQDVEGLAQCDPSELVSLGRISLKRASAWIEAAGHLLSSDELHEHGESAARARVTALAQELPFDVYRLKRSWSLSVEPMPSLGQFRVTGGLDPHLVDLSKVPAACDCLDFAKGHLCKHLLAVRRYAQDAVVLAADGALRGAVSGPNLNLTALWSR
jgi:helicase